MKSENVKEYELVRQEMITVKECMTKYIGFVLGGSGVAAYIIVGAVGQSAAKMFETAFICLVLSIIMTFVMLILCYKFFSHNRFAGYCKLLNHETYETTSDVLDRSFFAWEICVERLRASDMDPEVLLKLVRDVKLDDINMTKLDFVLAKYVGRNPDKDRYKFWKGLRILLLAIIGKIGTRSWGFPPMVVSLFFFIVFGFLLGGLYSVKEIHNMPNTILLDRNIIYVLAAAVLLGQLLLWWRFIGKLYSLMEGSATVDGFFVRFLPVRASFLNKYDIIPGYFYVNERLTEEMKYWGR